MSTQEKTELTIQSRLHNGDEDFMRVNQFLMDTYGLFQDETNWETRRWEGWYNHQPESDYLGERDWEKVVRLWETQDGTLVGVVIPESPGDVALQVHPDYRHLENEMLIWAEENLAIPKEDGSRWLITYAGEKDIARQELLKRRGYTTTRSWTQHRGPMCNAIPEFEVPEGYTIRSLRPGDFTDTLRWVATTSMVFGFSMSAERMRTFQNRAPSYDDNLHIIAETEEGIVAAFAGLTIDKQNRNAVFEPVGTHPDHRRKKLASIVMAEGLRRLRDSGLVDYVHVATRSDNPANILYDNMGLLAYNKVIAWEKTL